MCDTVENVETQLTSTFMKPNCGQNPSLTAFIETICKSMLLLYQWLPSLLLSWPVGNTLDIDVDLSVWECGYERVCTKGFFDDDKLPCSLLGPCIPQGPWTSVTWGKDKSVRAVMDRVSTRVQIKIQIRFVGEPKAPLSADVISAGHSSSGDSAPRNSPHIPATYCPPTHANKA